MTFVRWFTALSNPVLFHEILVELDADSRSFWGADESPGLSYLIQDAQWLSQQVFVKQVGSGVVLQHGLELEESAGNIWNYGDQMHVDSDQDIRPPNVR